MLSEAGAATMMEACVTWTARSYRAVAALTLLLCAQPAGAFAGHGALSLLHPTLRPPPRPAGLWRDERRPARVSTPHPTRPQPHLSRARLIVSKASMGSNTIPRDLPALGGQTGIASLRYRVRMLAKGALTWTTSFLSETGVQSALIASACYIFFPLFERPIGYLLPKGSWWLTRNNGRGTADIWGVFCPVVGILFATLISITVEKLWSRQQELRMHLNAEVTPPLPPPSVFKSSHSHFPFQPPPPPYATPQCFPHMRRPISLPHIPPVLGP